VGRIGREAAFAPQKPREILGYPVENSDLMPNELQQRAQAGPPLSDEVARTRDKGRNGKRCRCRA
jgi:hypothetical protein